MVRLSKLWIGGVAGLLLAGCSQLPLPAQVDLKARLGSTSSGEVEEEIEAGNVGELDFEHPTENGECVDFEDVDLPVTLESARLNYNAEVRYDGPELSGELRAQLYAAPSADDLWDERNRIGPSFRLDLDEPSTRLAGSARLTDAQVDAVNAKEVCWGLWVRGDSVSAEESGKATIEYDIQQLMLDIRFSVI